MTLTWCSRNLTSPCDWFGCGVCHFITSRFHADYTFAFEPIVLLLPEKLLESHNFTWVSSGSTAAKKSLFFVLPGVAGGDGGLSQARLGSLALSSPSFSEGNIQTGRQTEKNRLACFNHSARLSDGAKEENLVLLLHHVKRLYRPRPSLLRTTKFYLPWYPLFGDARCLEGVALFRFRLHCRSNGVALSLYQPWWTYTIINVATYK